MAPNVRSRPVTSAAVVLTAGLMLASCGHDAGQDSAQTAPPTTTPGNTISAGFGPWPSSPAGTPVGSLKELFEAVDQRLDCPGPAEGFSGPDPVLFLDNGEQLVGRQCGETILMAWSEDPAQIHQARELLLTTKVPVPMVSSTHWFVADTSAAGQGGTDAAQHQAASTDLTGLAHELGGEFTVG
ncbi:hypothetical protein [uncultured Citricoccus sp.]|uniref:hypothetical protein n=1 Tax=uncultured Citricoccus sp. TaxID=614031 RepID=UPI002602058F|nr:hypothetical protein [uncultured Citricoccus sp.]